MAYYTIILYLSTLDIILMKYSKIFYFPSTFEFSLFRKVFVFKMHFTFSLKNT